MSSEAHLSPGQEECKSLSRVDIWSGPMLQLPALVSARRFVGRLLSDSYYLAKWRSYFGYLQSLKKEPLLVYQMGKVGSSTIRSSLEANPEVQSRYSIYHVHWLGLERLLYEESLYKEAAKRYTGDPATAADKFFPGYVWSGQYLAKRIRGQSEKRQWTVITLVREPISRNISSFFQNLESLLSYDFRSRLESAGKEAVLEDLRSLFRKNVLEEGALERFDANPLTWFDSELKSVFGIDVYSTRFPADKGYSTYGGPRVRVLLLRVEDLDRICSVALSDFLQISDLKLIKENVGRDKAYSDLYDSFLKGLVLPTNYVDDVYDSKYARHFYTAQEIEIFRSRWRKQQA